jgi:predicted DNA-binding transcriptional regulator YafY
MSRSQRLLDLVQMLRTRKAPVSAEVLASDLGISVRTVYRDIETLRAQGATIETLPGVGVRLRPGFMLPPLMFTEDELEALMLGTRWVAAHTDDALARAAGSAIARIGAVLPADLRDELEASTLFAPNPAGPAPDPMLRRLREAIRGEVKVRIAYRDAAGAPSERVIWPISIGFFDQVRVAVAWCELRLDFRHFRTDRIDHLTVTSERLPRPRTELLADWRRRIEREWDRSHWGVHTDKN